jgi:hypothetical protein
VKAGVRRCDRKRLQPIVIETSPWEPGILSPSVTTPPSTGLKAFGDEFHELTEALAAQSSAKLDGLDVRGQGAACDRLDRR